MIEEESVDVAFIHRLSDKTLVVVLERKYTDRSAKQPLKVVQYESCYVVRDNPKRKLIGEEPLLEFAEAVNRDKMIAAAEQAAEKFRVKWDRVRPVKEREQTSEISNTSERQQAERKLRDLQQRDYEQILKRERGFSL